jgi:hypothetical protein
MRAHGRRWRRSRDDYDADMGGGRRAVALLRELQAHRVWVESPHGRVQATAHLTTRIHPEVVGVQHGFGHKAFGRPAKGRGTSDSALRPTKSGPLPVEALHKEACVRVARA